MFAKFVAFTHGPYYQVWLQHFPLAALIVVCWHPAFWFAATIGLWKNLWLDRKYQADWDEATAVLAASMYLAGAIFGLLI